MSVALVEQTIGGDGLLPTGKLYAYSRCVALNLWYVFRFINAKVEYKQLPVFPPTTFDNSTGWIATNRDVPANIDEVFVYSTHAYELYLPFMYTISTDPNHLYYSASAQSVSLAVATITYNAQPIMANDVTDFAKSLYNSATGFANPIMGTTTCFSVAVGGTKGGVPFYYIYLNGSAYALDAARCTVVGNAVVCFGLTVVGTTAYALLNNTGLMAKVQYDGITYYQLTIPATGEIVQFFNGYYIVKTTTQVFLYSINSNGSLITELTGTLDPTLPIELFNIV